MGNKSNTGSQIFNAIADKLNTISPYVKLTCGLNLFLVTTALEDNWLKVKLSERLKLSGIYVWFFKSSLGKIIVELSDEGDELSRIIGSSLIKFDVPASLFWLT